MICSVRSALLLVLTVATEIKAENTVMLVIGDNMDITCHFNLDGPDERWKMLFSSSNHSIAKCDVSRLICEKKLIDYGQLQGNCSSTTTPPNSDPLNGYQINLTCSLTKSFAGNVCCRASNKEHCYTFPLPTTNGINPEDEVENKNDGLYFVFAIILVVGIVAALVAVRRWKKFCNSRTAGDQNKAGGPPALPKKEDPPEQNDRSKAPVPTHIRSKPPTTTPVSGDADVPVTKVTKDEGLQYPFHEERTTSRVVKRRGPPANRGTLLQELMRQYNLSEEQLNREINIDFFYLAIYFDSVLMLSTALGLAPDEQADVDRLYYSKGTQAAMMECLKIWKEHNSSQATYRALLDIALSLGKEDTADKICRELTQHRTLD